MNSSTDKYFYCARLATDDGYSPGSGAWWARIRWLMIVCEEMP